MIGIFPYSDIEKVFTRAQEILEVSKTTLNGKVGWHQHLYKDRIGDTATAQALLLANILGVSIDDRSFQVLKENFIAVNEESGGWSFLTNGNEITTPATAIVIKSLISNDFNDDIVWKGINWLLSAQNEDGGWGLQSNSESCLYSTYIVISTLKEKEIEFNLTNELCSKVKSWIIEKQNEDGGWGNLKSNPIETAFALLCLKTLEFNNEQLLKRGVKYLYKNWNSKNMWENTKDTFDFEVEDSTNNLRRLKFKFYVTPWVIKALLLNNETIENNKIERSLKWILRKTKNEDFKCDIVEEKGYFWAFYDSITVLYLFKQVFKEQKFDKIISFHKIQFTLNRNDYFSAIIATLLICIPAFFLGILFSNYVLNIPKLVSKHIDVSFVYIFCAIYITAGGILMRYEKIKFETFISLVILPVIFGLVGL